MEKQNNSLKKQTNPCAWLEAGMGFLKQVTECFAANFIAEVHIWMIQQFYVFGSGILGRVTTLSACTAVVG